MLVILPLNVHLCMMHARTHHACQCHIHPKLRILNNQKIDNDDADDDDDVYASIMYHKCMLVHISLFFFFFNLILLIRAKVGQCLLACLLLFIYANFSFFF